MNVPKNKLLGRFFSGFLISPAIKVTLFQASLENKELIIVVEIAIIKPQVVKSVTVISPVSALKTVLLAVQVVEKFSSKYPDLTLRIIPKIIKMNRANNLELVKIN